SGELTHLRELLKVNSSWRQVALEFLWRKLEFDLTTNEVHLKRPDWVKWNSLPPNAANLVKEIHVLVPMPRIVSGLAHKLLDDYIGDTRCLPLAKKLHVIISGYNRQKFDPNDKEMAMANALEFAKLLRSFTPVVAM
ncbi:hypothetical protein GGI16_004935, partial [Coemansia sp. S142-1]